MSFSAYSGSESGLLPPPARQLALGALAPAHFSPFKDRRMRRLIEHWPGRHFDRKGKGKGVLQFTRKKSGSYHHPSPPSP